MMENVKIASQSKIIDDNYFVIVVLAHHSVSDFKRCLYSIFAQSYTNFRVVIVDDDPDRQEQRKDIITHFRKLCDDEEQISAIFHSTVEFKGTKSLLQGCIDAKPNDIICWVDSDDFLCDNDALWLLNKEYKKGFDTIWTDSRSNFDLGSPQNDRRVPPGVDVYKFHWRTGHLQTFHRYLLNGIPAQNFYNVITNDWSGISTDQYLYLAILHQAKNRHFFPHKLYHWVSIYNEELSRQGGAQDAAFKKRGYISEGVSWEEVLKTEGDK